MSLNKTNAVLCEAERKNIELENKQQAKKILQLEKYIQELHSHINKDQKYALRPHYRKSNFASTGVDPSQRSFSCNTNVLRESNLENKENMAYNYPLQNTLQPNFYPTKGTEKSEYEGTESSNSCYKVTEQTFSNI